MQIAAATGLFPLSFARPSQNAAGASTGTASANLSREEQDQVRELQQTDQEIRMHEQAHKTAGGPYAGAIRLDYTTGPDGRRYATAGEVPIDASPVRGDPEATITKMEVVKRAALAPADPSPQDRAVAAQADATKAQAQSELRDQRQQEGEADAATGRGDASGAAALTAEAKRAQAAYGGSQAPAATIFSLIA